MTQLNDEHFEIIEKNKVERYERQKLTYLEDRVKVLETALESHAKILARFQMTEGVFHKGEKIAENTEDLFTKMLGGKS
jgi:hypothetical protein